MNKIRLSKEHKEKLAEYGLENIAPDSCRGFLFTSGEDILREGADISWLLIIVRGNAKVCRTAPNGKSLVLCYYMSSGVIGDIELLTDERNACCTVEAITDFECIAVSYKACQKELKKNLRFSNKLGTELATKLFLSSDNHAALALCSGKQRLCTYILQNSHRGLFSDVLTDVACSVGLSYRHMFRILGELCNEGILEKRESGYYLLNPSALKESATIPVKI